MIVLRLRLVVLRLRLRLRLVILRLRSVLRSSVLLQGRRGIVYLRTSSGLLDDQWLRGLGLAARLNRLDILRLNRLNLHRLGAWLITRLNSLNVLRLRRLATGLNSLNVLRLGRLTTGLNGLHRHTFIAIALVEVSALSESGS